MPMPTGIRGSIRPAKTSKPINLTSCDPPDPPERRDSGEIRGTRLSTERRPSGAVMDFFNKDKRHSLGLGLGGKKLDSPDKGSPKNSPSLTPTKSAKLAIDMESPPLVFYGTPNHSTGALLSGQLLLTVIDPDIQLQSFTMNLVARVTNKRPIGKDCPNCQIKNTQLFAWDFLTEPTHYKAGVHDFPFSHLLPGHLPATSHGELGFIDYVLEARAVCAMSDNITVSRTLTVQRALPSSDKISIRVFPPTNLNVKVNLPSAIHPIGEFPVQMSVTGLIDPTITSVQRRWRVRRVTWKIEESSKIISPACAKHANKVGGEGKGILHEDTRVIGADEMKDGWKSDFDTPGGEITHEFSACIRANSQPVCDVESPTGLSVNHQFVVEIIVAEEQTMGRGHKGAVPTGSARVLRMQFKVVVTERAGMGISWDEEMPPMYEDVPSSPPGYARIEDFEGELPGEEELESLQT